MNRSSLHSRFLSIVPVVERIARQKLNYIVDHDTRADTIAEVVAVCWQWFQRLAAKGKDARRFSARLAYLAVRFVSCGRRVWGSESLRDPLSLRARRRGGFRVQQLEERGDYDDPVWQEALHDNTQTPVPDQAAFRQDFPHWLRRLGRRNRQLAVKMMLGERTSHLSRKFGLSEGRVSQLRREFEDDWRQYHGEPVAAKRETVAA